MQYTTRAIEEKAKKKWSDLNVYKVTENQDKPKYYILDMFPYPSGSGLHVGHPLGYVATDIVARYKRLCGYNVLHPMGFDSFGLPAEQYAIETGQHPIDITKTNIDYYKSQLQNLGFSFDWSRMINTSSPEYYKWTQWIFMQLFNHFYDPHHKKAKHIDVLIEKYQKDGGNGFSAEEWNAFSEKQQSDVLMQSRLAYIDFAEVNWCEALGTVLANDEVINGKSERGGHPVVKKKMRQWSLRLTQYADRLLKNLDTLDWPESLKDQQRNWIGRSEGAEIDFEIENDIEKRKVKVFTTRPDTIFGVSFMVLSPEHDFVNSITTVDQKNEIEAYIQYCKSRSDIERQSEKKVSGCFTGSYCIHPFTGNRIPIYIAEYVLAGYGTGAIMAVPSDDERDRKFAEKFKLNIVDIIDKSAFPNASIGDKVGVLMQSDFLNGLNVKDAISTVCNRLEEMKIGVKKVQFKLRDANFSRQRYWGEPFPVIWKNDIPYLLSEDQLPVMNPVVDEIKPAADGSSPLARNEKWLHEIDGYTRETNTMPGYAGSSWYFLRYMDPHNTRELVSDAAVEYWGQVDFYLGGSEHAVGHLLYSRFWNNFLYDIGKVPFEEPFKKLINQGMIQGRSSIVYRSIENSNVFVSKNIAKSFPGGCLPIHVDVNIVENDVLDIEALKKWRTEFETAEFILEEGKMLCDYETEKMSKRYFNVVNPDDMISKYGCDCFRMYEMFLGPIEMSKPWNTNGIDGVSKFLKKYWALYFDENGSWVVEDTPASKDEMKILHKCIKRITEDIDRFSLNTCVSTFMITVNELQSMNCHKSSVLRDLSILISPFAPHIADVIWEQFENGKSIVLEKYPSFDPSILIENEFEYPVSINGKTRTKLLLPLNIEQIELEAIVVKDESVKKWLEGKEIKKIIWVKGRMINIVV